jgi:hypothetical protein
MKGRAITLRGGLGPGHHLPGGIDARSETISPTQSPEICYACTIATPDESMSQVSGGGRKTYHLPNIVNG